uniref:non-specific lipid-transfer protein 1-like isoform X1 n=1 Tax=Erigeron canadensis TaxID=72917 RepID=UPI001CB8BEC4|nr:non-specific lipid-transfer protein 1-like isoform X1 [Erigeron canadensis]
MEGGAKVALVATLVAIVVASVPRSSESAVTCQLVVSRLTPCATYLIRGGQVPQTCCHGVQTLYKEANTKTDRQIACTCMEQAANLVPGLNINYASELPTKCDVSIPYKISRTFDCSTVE